jgi:two-component system phosphate regulon response regulator PhoB
VRSIAYRFDDVAGLARTVRDGDQELALPDGESVGDGEWVVAVLTTSCGHSTAAAARGVDRGGGDFALVFDARDWDRIVTSCEASAPPDDAAIPLRARVLVVDDDPDIRDVVSAMLTAVGLETDRAPSAEQAVQSLRGGAFDLVILDWNLPGKTGVELCRELRRDPQLATLPVLFLTAHTCSKDMDEAFASGADDYVVKPFRAPELRARVFGLLCRPRRPSPRS